jgi:hypothetical protein
MNTSNVDFYIRNSSHPNYEINRIIEDEIINVIIQKLEMLIFTNTGDVYGEPYFGSNLEYYLWSTDVPSEKIESDLIIQVNKYIPELNQIGYKININIYEGTLKDIMHLNFTINEYNIKFILD